MKRRNLPFVILAMAAFPIIISCIRLAVQVQQAQIDHALIVAIKTQDTSAAIRLLSQGANADAQDRPWNPVTFHSLLADTLARFRGIQPVKDTNHYSSAIALWYTRDRKPNSINNIRAAPENVPLIQALLDHGANVNGADWDGMGVLHHAVLADHFQTVALLLEHRANPDLRYSDLHLTPLWYARPREAELLIAHGADVHLRNADGETALWNTPVLTGLGTARVLVAHGARVTATNNAGRTILVSMARLPTRTPTIIRFLMDQQRVELLRK